MTNLNDLLEALPASKGLLPDEGQIDRVRALVAASYMTLRMGEREPSVQTMLHEALRQLAGRETP